MRTCLHIAGRYARKSRYFFGKLHLQDSADVVDADIAVRQSSRSTAANVQSFVEFLGNNRTVISGKLHAVVQGCHFVISRLVFINNASNTVRTVDAGLTFFNMNVYTVRAVNTVYAVFTVNADLSVFAVFTYLNGFGNKVLVHHDGNIAVCIFYGLNIFIAIFGICLRAAADDTQGFTEVFVNYPAIISDKVHSLGRQVVRNIRRRIRYGVIYLIRQVIYVYDFASVVTRCIGYVGNMRAARLIDVRAACHGDGVFIHDTACYIVLYGAVRQVVYSRLGSHILNRNRLLHACMILVFYRQVHLAVSIDTIRLIGRVVFHQTVIRRTGSLR